MRAGSGTKEAGVFRDRQDAGGQLADRLATSAGAKPVVVALPRGGVPVAAEVADRLDAPLDIIVVRKIGSPWQPEYGIGAIAEGDVQVLNDAAIAELGIEPAELESTIARERAELARRVTRYRRGTPAIGVAGRLVILVDDGLATGYTARAAIEATRRVGAGRVILAVPVASEDGVSAMRRLADEVVAVVVPRHLRAIGDFYLDFGQTSDEEVISSLEAAAARMRQGTSG